MPLASLVIPTRNRAPALARTLAALTVQTEPGFEVIIADDGSDDDTPAVVKRWGERLDLRYLRRAQRGIAAARTAAMRAATGRVLIQTDDDRLASATFVADHVAAHAGATPVVAAGAHGAILAHWSAAAGLPASAIATLVARDPTLAPRLGAPEVELITPQQVIDDLPGAVARLGLAEPWWAVTVAPLVARYGADLAGFAFPWSLAIGGNTSVPRALAEQVDFLDERFVGWGLEDTDFNFRLCQAGAQVRMLDGGLAHHQLHARSRDLGRQWLANAHRMIHKHGSTALSSYVVAIQREASLVEASDLVAQLAAAPPPVRAEVLRCHRELISLALR